MGPSVPAPQPVKLLLVQRRISQRAFARRIGVTPEYLGRVLNGYEPPSDRLAAACAEALGEPVALLFRPRSPALKHPGDAELRAVPR